MYFNRYNITWIVCLGLLFFTSYGAVNHLTAYLNTIHPVSSFVLPLESHIPFIPAFIYPYMSIDLLYGLAFFIIAKGRYSDEKYHLIIKGLGLQLLINQLFSLICFLSFPLKFSFSKPDIPPSYNFLFNSLLNFDLPYNQTPSLHISILVILMVFYNQHLISQWLKWFLNCWFILIGLSVLFTYQHHIIDLFMGAFLGLALVLMFNYSPHYSTSFHVNPLGRKTKIYKNYLIVLGLFLLGLFVIPLLNTFNLLTFHINHYLYVICWFMFVSIFTVVKIMFYGNHFGIRKNNHRFTKSFYFIGYIYIRFRHLSIQYLNRYKKNIQILPYLWIGSLFSVRRQKNLDDNVSIINLAWEGDNKQPQTIGYPLVDLVIPTKEQAIEIATKMKQLIDNGKTVYVHCALGMFRTIFISGSYLILYENKKSEDIIDFFMSYPLDSQIKDYLHKKRELFLLLFQQIEDCASIQHKQI